MSVRACRSSSSSARKKKLSHHPSPPLSPSVQRGVEYIPVFKPVLSPEACNPPPQLPLPDPLLEMEDSITGYTSCTRICRSHTLQSPLQRNQQTALPELLSPLPSSSLSYLYQHEREKKSAKRKEDTSSTYRVNFDSLPPRKLFNSRCNDHDRLTNNTCTQTVLETRSIVLD